ncbi:MAG: dihydrofolate reductase family protein [Rhizobacter sp.]|nr:dihydrofolate reductase family protein [Ferruginibacter sp.]
MRKISLKLAITLDGFIEKPNAEMDWLVRDEETDFGDIHTEILSDKDIIFYGRISYDKWGNFHPDGNESQKTKDAYNLMHSKQKYVFSKTKKDDTRSSQCFVRTQTTAQPRSVSAQATALNRGDNLGCTPSLRQCGCKISY